jgi:hypothetical protein
MFLYYTHTFLEKVLQKNTFGKSIAKGLSFGKSIAKIDTLVIPSYLCKER